MSMFRVRGITIRHNGTDYPDGTVIDLTESETSGVRQFLEPVPEITLAEIVVASADAKQPKKKTKQEG